jgi:beta-glucosidase
VTIANTSAAAVSGWTLNWTFGGNQVITGWWNVDITQTGSSVTARNVGHNPSIPPSGDQSFGFQGTYSGTNASPAAFTLNGTACTVG